MATIYKFRGVEISKRQYAFIRFLEAGSNDFVECYNYTENKKRGYKDIRFFASWFNRTLKQLQKRGLLSEIPFVYRMGNGWVWSNPGVRGSKANFECFTLNNAQMEFRAEQRKII